MIPLTCGSARAIRLSTERSRVNLGASGMTELRGSVLGIASSVGLFSFLHISCPLAIFNWPIRPLTCYSLHFVWVERPLDDPTVSAGRNGTHTVRLNRDA